MSRARGKGVHCTHDVCETLDAPFDQAADQRKGVGGGIYDHHKGRLSQPGASGRMPRKFFEGIEVRTPKAATNNSIPRQGPSRRGTK